MKKKKKQVRNVTLALVWVSAIFVQALGFVQYAMMPTKTSIAIIVIIQENAKIAKEKALVLFVRGKGTINKRMYFTIFTNS